MIHLHELFLTGSLSKTFCLNIMSSVCYAHLFTFCSCLVHLYQSAFVCVCVSVQVEMCVCGCGWFKFLAWIICTRFLHFLQSSLATTLGFFICLCVKLTLFGLSLFALLIIFTLPLIQFDSRSSQLLFLLVFDYYQTIFTVNLPSLMQFCSFLMLSLFSNIGLTSNEMQSRVYVFCCVDCL